MTKKTRRCSHNNRQMTFSPPTSISDRYGTHLIDAWCPFCGAVRVAGFGWRKLSKPDTSVHGSQGTWKPIFNGMYQVSASGLVRRCKPGTGNSYVGRLLKQKKVKRGTGNETHYAVVIQIQRGRTKSKMPVHQLVALGFHGPRPVGHEIDHKNGNAWDNRARNLHYVTPAEHRRLTRLRSQRSKRFLTNRQVRAVRRRISKGEGLKSIGDRFGVSYNVIQKMRDGKTYRDIK